MSDLISRSKLLKEIEVWGGCVEALHEYISIMPTAYDVEKVVAELEKLKQHNKELSEGTYLEDDKSFYYCAYTNFARAIEIVKRGGVE